MRGGTGSVTLAAKLPLPGVRQRGLLLAQGGKHKPSNASAAIADIPDRRYLVPKHSLGAKYLVLAIYLVSQPDRPVGTRP